MRRSGGLRPPPITLCLYHGSATCGSPTSTCLRVPGLNKEAFMVGPIDVNRRNWDERATIHARDRIGGYMLDRFRAGEDALHAIEAAELGDISRKARPPSAMPYRARHALPRATRRGSDRARFFWRGAGRRAPPFLGDRVKGRLRSRDCGRGPASDTWSVRFGFYDLGNDLLAAGYYGLGESNRIRAGARRRTLLCRCSSELPRAGGARRQARAHVRFPDTRRPAPRILRCDDLHRRSDHHDASIHSEMDSSTFGDPQCANRCRPDYRDVSRARGLAVARGVELGTCIGQTMAPSRWSSAHSPIHFGESEKGVWMTTDSRLERSFEVEHLPRRG